MPPIDGSEVLRQVKERRNSVPSGYGEVTNSDTGNILASAFSNKPAQPIRSMSQNQPPSQQQMISDAYDDIDRDMIYAKEMAEGGDNSAEMLAKGAQQSYVNGEMPMESFTPEELKNTQRDYLNQAGKFSNFAQENNIDMNELYDRFPEEYTQEDIGMFKDARKIKNFDDAVKVGIMSDEMADFMDLDTDKFFGPENIVEKCGAECQEKRRIQKAQRQEEYLSMDDTDFEKLPQF